MKTIRALLPARKTLATLCSAALLMSGLAATSKAEFLLGSIHFNSPAGFTSDWTSVQFSISNEGTSVFSGSPYYTVASSGSSSLTSGLPFTFFSAYLTDGNNGAIRLTESFKNGASSLGGLFQDSTESASINRTAYGNHYGNSTPDFQGYTISRLQLTVADISKTVTPPDYIANYNTNFNIYGDLIPVPEPGQIAASLALLGFGGVVALRKRMSQAV